jgi:putative colanic acid biosynthesis UDP-glucose lipid carrier transferase
MNKQFKRYLQGSLIILDLLMLIASFWLLRQFFHERIPLVYNSAYVLFWAYSLLVWLLVGFFSGTYTEKVILQFETFTQRTVQVYILSMVLLLIYLFFLREMSISRLFIVLYLLMFGVGLSINRFLYVGIRNYIKNKENLFNKVVILGYNETALKLASYFEQESINTQLLGFVEDENNIRELTRYPIMSDVKNVIQVAKDMDVQEIYSTITPEQNHFIYDLMNQAENECIRFKVVPNLAYFFSRPVVVDYVRDLPILSLRSEPLEDVGNRFKKRTLDLTISLLVTVFVLSWMIPIIGLLIFIESRGPIFFKQARTGKNNQPFFCLKFRSMRPNREADLMQATKHDQRITRIGRFLRKTSLDEFPQFINVLRGEMSLVGPRPHMVKHTDDYSKVVEQYMIRHFVKPGITGWAQVNGFRGEISEPRQIKLRVQNDLWYLENWNIWLDIRILFMTIYTIIRGDKNAY